MTPDRSNPDGRENSIFLFVHFLVRLLIVIVETNAMQDTMNNVQQQFLAQGVVAITCRPIGNIAADCDIGVYR
jgi:hypothetical protein